MTTTSSPDVAPTEEVSPAFEWLRDAAIALGAAEEVAAHFGNTGYLQLNEVLLLVQTRSDLPDDWIVMARIAKPARASEARWHDALLAANTQTMVMMPAAFTLDDSAAVLVLRVPQAHCGDPLLLSADLYGLLCISEALQQGVDSAAAREEGGAPPPPADATPASEGRAEEGRTEEDRAEAEAVLDALASRPLFRAELHAVLRECVVRLGGDAAAQRHLLANGELQVDGACVGMAADLDGETLVVTAEIGASVAGEAHDASLVLGANMELLACAGVAVGALAGRRVLLGRWEVAGRTAEDLAVWIRMFLDLARSMQARAGA